MRTEQEIVNWSVKRLRRIVEAVAEEFPSAEDASQERYVQAVATLILADLIDDAVTRLEQRSGD